MTSTKDESKKRTASTEGPAADSKNALASTKPQAAEQSSTKKPESKQRSEANLNRRGRKPRTAVTQQEFDFCIWLVLTGNVKEASTHAGFNAWRGYELLDLPRIKCEIQKLQERMKEESWQNATKQTDNLRASLDDEFKRRLRKMKTHPTLGDSSVPKMFEVGWKRTGDIGGPKVTPAAQRRQTIEGELVASRVHYMSPWIRQLYGINDPRSEAVDREYDDASGAPASVPAALASTDTTSLSAEVDGTADAAREPMPSLIPPAPADQPSDIATADAARATVNPQKTGKLGLTKADYDAIRAALSPEDVAKFRAIQAAYRAADREPW